MDGHEERSRWIESDERRDETRVWSARAPVVVFATVEVCAFAFWMVIGRHAWFYHDEWDFLAARRLGDVGDLLRSHGGHWTTLPIVAYRVMFWAFGLRAYLPYRVVVAVVYLAMTAVLYLIIRAARVNAWIATAAASFFALFGAGWANATLPFQITFTGSLLFGLVHLRLADKDGPFDRRDAVGLGAGALGLMTSNVALVMVAAVGIAVWLRRGWRTMAVHTLPLAAIYVAWFAAGGHTGAVLTHPTLLQVEQFTARGLTHTFNVIGPVGFFGVALAVLLVAGLLKAIRQRKDDDTLRELAAPAALLCGALAFFVVVASARGGNGTNGALPSRYTSVVTAMLLPALAVAADALARNRRYAVAIAASVFVIGVPRNLHDAVTQQDALSHFQNEVREVLLPIAHDPRAATVPPSLRPEPVTADPVTVGWLLHTAAQHRLPVPKPPIDYHGADFRLAFDLQQRSVPNEHCTSVRTSFSPTLRQGDVLSVSADGLVIAPQPRQQLFKDLYLFFPAQPGKTIVVLHDPGPVHITPPPRHRHEARVCIQHNGG